MAYSISKENRIISISKVIAIERKLKWMLKGFLEAVTQTKPKEFQGVDISFKHLSINVIDVNFYFSTILHNIQKSIN